MNNQVERVIRNYIETYRGMIVGEPIDDNSVTLSFPFRFSGNHRIELTVTSVAEKRFVLSDMGRTIGELENFGYRVGAPFRKKLEEISRGFGLRIVGDFLLVDSNPQSLGEDMQRFLEAAKTIGDAYLVHRTFVPKERDLEKEVRDILNKRNFAYKEKEKIQGKIEVHSVNFYLPSNGRAALAIAVLPWHNSHLVAEAWGFKCEDIKAEQKRLQVGLIYDTSKGDWASESKQILHLKSDFAFDGNSLPAFETHLQK